MGLTRDEEEFREHIEKRLPSFAQGLVGVADGSLRALAAMFAEVEAALQTQQERSFLFLADEGFLDEMSRTLRGVFRRDGEIDDSFRERLKLVTDQVTLPAILAIINSLLLRKSPLILDDFADDPLKDITIFDPGSTTADVFCIDGRTCLGMTVTGTTARFVGGNLSEPARNLTGDEGYIESFIDVYIPSAEATIEKVYATIGNSSSKWTSYAWPESEVARDKWVTLAMDPAHIDATLGGGVDLTTFDYRDVGVKASSVGATAYFSRLRATSTHEVKIFEYRPDAGFLTPTGSAMDTMFLGMHYLVSGPVGFIVEIVRQDEIETDVQGIFLSKTGDGAVGNTSPFLVSTGEADPIGGFLSPVGFPDAEIYRALWEAVDQAKGFGVPFRIFVEAL